MNSHTIFTNDEKAKTSSSEKQLQTYLQKVGVSYARELSYAQRRKIFVTVVADYQNDAFGLEELSNIAGSLWSTMTGMDKAATDLGDILFDSMESSCPFCHPGDQHLPKNVKDYYERFKMLGFV